VLVCVSAQAGPWVVQWVYQDSGCSGKQVGFFAILQGNNSCNPVSCTNATYLGLYVTSTCNVANYPSFSGGNIERQYDVLNCKGTPTSGSALLPGFCLPSGPSSSTRYNCGSITDYSTSDCTGTGQTIGGAAGKSVCEPDGNGGSIYAKECGTACFHEDTVIEYADEKHTLASLQKEGSVCAVPHVFSDDGVKIHTSCKGMGPLRLTGDHLVYTQKGLVVASSIVVGDFVYSDLEENNVCEVTKIQHELGETYFGLSCEESVVLANGFKTSTFGNTHTLPALWMKVVSKVVGVHRATAWGEKIVSFLNEMGVPQFT